MALQHHSRSQRVSRYVKSRNPKILATLYRSISRPLLKYAVPVWCPALTTLQDSLERVQRRFTRFCLGLPRRALINHDNDIAYSDRCIQLGLPFLNNRLHFLSLMFVVKCLYNNFDVPINDCIGINSRHVNTVKFHHLRARTNAAHHSLIHRFPRLWEALPLSVKDTVVFGLSQFNNSLRDHLLTPGIQANVIRVT